MKKVNFELIDKIVGYSLSLIALFMAIAILAFALHVILQPYFFTFTNNY